MTAHDRIAEAPLVIGDDAVGPSSLPRGGTVTTPSGAGTGAALVWGIVGLGVALAALAIAGIGLRPSASEGVVAELVDPSPAVSALDEPADTVVNAPGRRQTVTVWSLPTGVSTWWPLGAHVVFLSDRDQPDPRVFVHDKVSGRATWSQSVQPGQVVVVRDPDTADSVRFTVPAPVGAAGVTGDRPGGVVDPTAALDDEVLELSVQDGSHLATG